ncbi:MAG: SRPBCC domain-containing protein [Parcubacteria group bacterium]|jgi:uncharacterized protein YndB with AHSA1/START domain
MEKSNNGQKIIIERVFNVPKEKAWKAWTDPEMIKKWWGPKDFTAPHISLDLRAGGKFLYSMRGKAGPDQPVRDFWNTGKFMKIVPREKIVSSVSFADEQGNPVPASHYDMPDQWPMETKSTTIFEETADGKTKLTVREAGIPEEMAEPARMGWEQSLDKFQKVLEQ